MKLKAPENGAPVHWRDQVYAIRRDGSVEVPEELARDLISHGFVPWPEADARPARRSV